MPKYYGLTDKTSYTNFQSEDVVKRYVDSFNHNLIEASKGGSAGILINSLFDFLGDAGKETIMLCEAFDGSICEQQDLNPNYQNEYVIYSSIDPSKGIVPILNIVDLFSNIVAGVPPVSIDKVNKVLKGFKTDIPKQAKKFFDEYQKVSSVADAVLDVTELFLGANKDYFNYALLDNDTQNNWQDHINWIRNLKGNLESLGSVFKSLGYEPPDNDEPENVSLILDIFELLDIKGVGKYIKDIKKIPTYDGKLHSTDIIAAILLSYTLSFKENDFLDYIKSSDKIEVKFKNIKTIAAPIYLSINSLRALKQGKEFADKYAETLFKKGYLDVGGSKVNRFDIAKATLKTIRFLLKKNISMKEKHKISSYSYMDLLKEALERPFKDIKENVEIIKIVTGLANGFNYSNVDSFIKYIVSKVIFSFENSIDNTVVNGVTNLIQNLAKTNIIFAVANGANELTGKAVAFIYFPNKITFKLKTDKQNVYFSSGIQGITPVLFEKGIVLPWDNKDFDKHNAFLKVPSKYGAYGVIVTSQNNPAWYRPYFQTIFKESVKEVEDKLGELDERIFARVKWDYLVCPVSSVDTESIDVSKCRRFLDNNLVYEIKGDDIDGDIDLYNDDFIKETENKKGSYFDFFDYLASKWCAENTTFGNFRPGCSEKNANFNIYNKTRGIFIDRLSAKFYGIDGIDSKFESPKMEVPYFKFANARDIEIDISEEKDFVRFQNNSDFPLIIMLMNSKDFGKQGNIKYYSFFLSPNQYRDFSYSLLSSFGEKIKVVAVDSLLNAYGKYTKIQDPYLALLSLKSDNQELTNKNLSYVEFLYKYSNEHSTYSFMRTKDIILNKPPVIESLYAVEDCMLSRQCDKQKIYLNFKVYDQDDEDIRCRIDWGNGEIEEVDCKPYEEETVSKRYAKPGTYIVILYAEDNHYKVSNNTVVQIESERGLNNPPNILEFQADRKEVFIGETVTFRYNVKDVDKDPIVCKFDFDGDGNTDKTVNNCSSGMVSYVYNTKGSFSAKLTVSDGLSSNEENKAILVEEKINSYLKVNAAVDPTNLYLKEGETGSVKLTISTNASNLNNLKCYYEYKGNKSDIDCNGTATIDVSYKDSGINIITVYAEGTKPDGSILIDSTNINFYVNTIRKRYVLEFISENYKDGTAININDDISSIEKKWTLKMTNTHSATLYIEKDTSKPCNLTIDSKPYYINVSEGEIFDVNVTFKKPDSVGDFECHFKIRDENGKYYKIGNSDNIWIKLKVIANNLIVHTNTNTKLLKPKEPVYLLINISNGNSPYNVYVNWGDGTTNEYVLNDSDEIYKHVYSNEGTYKIYVSVVDKANKFYENTIDITVLPEITKTSWYGKVDINDDVSKSINSEINVKEKTLSNGQKYYEYTLSYTPPSDKVYYFGYYLPVPDGILDLNKGKVRLTFVTKTGGLKYYDREFWISTNSFKLGVIPINNGYYQDIQTEEGFGQIIKKDLTTGSVERNYYEVLSDMIGAYSFSRYTIELDTNGFSVYRYEKDTSGQYKNRKLLSEDIYLGNSIKEIGINLRGSGKVIAAILEYDTNNDGKFDKKLILNTKDKIVDWSKLQIEENNDTNNKPIINQFTADNTKVNVNSEVTFRYDVSDLDKDRLLCEFDFDGDGILDKTIQDCSSGTVSYIYIEAGTYNAKLKVSDGKELSDKSLFIEVNNNAQSQEAYDFQIIDMKLLDQLEPNSQVRVSVSVQNVGNIPSQLGEIFFYYKIPQENKVTSFPKGESYILISDELAPGETRTYEATLKFRDRAWTDNNGEEHDLVLRPGTTYIVAKIEDLKQGELNVSNNIYELPITYTDSDQPVIDYFRIDGNHAKESSLSNPFYVYEGSNLSLSFLFSDNNIAKRAEVYIKHNNEDWQLIGQKENIEKMKSLQHSFNWKVPDYVVKDDILTFKLVVYDETGNFAEKVIGPVEVVSTVKDIQVLSPKEGDVYTVGDTINVELNFGDGIPPKTVSIYYYYNESNSEWLGEFTDLNNISVKLPDTNLKASDRAYLLFNIRDELGNTLKAKSGYFKVKRKIYNQDIQGKTVEIFTYPSLPPQALYKSQEIIPISVHKDNSTNNIHVVYLYKERYVEDNPNDSDANTGYYTYEKIQLYHDIYDKNLDSKISSNTVTLLNNKRVGKYFSFSKNIAVYSSRVINSTVYVLYGDQENLYLLDLDNNSKTDINTGGKFYAAKLLKIGNNLFVAWRLSSSKIGYLKQMIPFYTDIDTSNKNIYPDDTENLNLFGCFYHDVCSIKNNSLILEFTSSDSYIENRDNKHISGDITITFYKFSGNSSWEVYGYNGTNIETLFSIEGVSQIKQSFTLENKVIVLGVNSNNIIMYVWNPTDNSVSKYTLSDVNETFASDLDENLNIYILFKDSKLKLIKSKIN